MNRAFPVLLAAAIALGNAAPAVASEAISALNEEGVRAFKAGDLRSAIYYFKRAIEQAPENDVVRLNLMNAYQSSAAGAFEEGDPEGALDDLDRAIDLAPEQAGPLILMGSIHLNLGDNDDAIYRLEEAIELQPENVDAHFLLGESYYRDNDVNAALDQWEWVHQQRPNYPGLTQKLEMARRESVVEEDFEDLRSRHFNATYNPDVRPADIRSILRILEDAYFDIGRALGRTYPPSTIHVTLYNAEGFSETTQMGEHIVGLFDGTRIRCPVLRDDGTLVPYEQLEEVLYHEYVHVVLRYLVPNGVPWWLNEGLAESLSSSVTAHNWALLRYALDNDLLFDFQTLSAHQLNRLPPDRLDIAYRQSHAAVQLMLDDVGRYRMVSALQRMAEGQDAEAALDIECRHDYDELFDALVDAIEAR